MELEMTQRPKSDISHKHAPHGWPRRASLPARGVTLHRRGDPDLNGGARQPRPGALHRCAAASPTARAEAHIDGAGQLFVQKRRRRPRGSPPRRPSGGARARRGSLQAVAASEMRRVVKRRASRSKLASFGPPSRPPQCVTLTRRTYRCGPSGAGRPLTPRTSSVASRDAECNNSCQNL